jgi:hypothetical protein
LIPNKVRITPTGHRSIWWSPWATFRALIGNRGVSGYLERHHPEILTEFRAIVAATSLEEGGSGVSEEPALLD